MFAQNICRSYWRIVKLPNVCKVQLISSQQMSTLKRDDFYDHKNIFKFKTTKELYRGAILLKISSLNFFVDNSLMVCSDFSGIIINSKA